MLYLGEMILYLLLVLGSYQCYCEDIYMLLCEGQQKTASCPNNSTIDVTSASYGYNWNNTSARRYCDGFFSRNNLFPWRDVDNVECHEPGSTAILRNECQGLSECLVIASNNVFGNPCSGITTYLELFYRCEQLKDTNTYTIGYHVTEKSSVSTGIIYAINEEGNMKGLVLVVAVSVCIPVVLITVLILGLLILHKKRTKVTRNKQNNRRNLKRNYARGNHMRASINLEYETVGSNGSNPTTDPPKQLPAHYETSIHVSTSTYQYDYAVEPVFVNWSEHEAKYVNEKE